MLRWFGWASVWHSGVMADVSGDCEWERLCCPPVPPPALWLWCRIAGSAPERLVLSSHQEGKRERCPFPLILQLLLSYHTLFIPCFPLHAAQSPSKITGIIRNHVLLKTALKCCNTLSYVDLCSLTCSVCPLNALLFYFLLYFSVSLISLFPLLHHPSCIPGLLYSSELAYA